MPSALFDPARHEPLGGDPWDETRARAAIADIVRDAEQARTGDGHWPVHPLDAEGDVPATGFKSVYLGSAGLLWALWYLQRHGAVRLTIDPAEGIRAACDAYRAAPDTGEVVPSYFLGEVGVLLVRGRVTAWDEVADDLFASIRSNIGNPTNEALWAAPGTMMAAWHLWEATREARWRDLFLENVEQVWNTWLLDERQGCYLWTQDMYGRITQFLGAGHGFAGNVFPLLTGAALLGAERREALYERCVTTLGVTATVAADAVNWRPSTGAPRPGRAAFLMQWCHGAPGIVTALSPYPSQRSAEMEALLVGAGNAVWNAGPLTKGYGLCHGTAGNGYAFLALYRRTGLPLWLERARLFAMHAIAQRERMKREHGQGRFNLWTGDAGLAVFLWHCLAGESGMPMLDIID
jgi:hypothetical protein